jgi:hypothetical protein
MNKPKKLGLYKKIKKGIYSRIPKHSAYRSGLVVKKYKEEFKKKYGDEPAYEGTKKGSNLDRWFREKWESDTGKIGYTDKSSVYRPTIRITKDTPKTFSELSNKDIKKAKIEKAKTGRVRKFGGFKFGNLGKRQRDIVKMLTGDGLKPEFKKSTRKDKKYMVRYNNKLIHFGAIKNGIPMDQYKDSTGLGLYSKYDHNDEKRRDNYRARHSKIKIKDGSYAYKNKDQPSYWSWHFLW